MNTNDLTIFLISTTALAGGLAAIIYYIFDFLRTRERAARNRPVYRSSEGTHFPGFKRRRAAPYPGIICALPMHQVKRADAPMTDIWTR